MLVYLDLQEKIVFNVTKEELDFMINEKIVSEKEGLYVVNKDSCFSYLFNTNIYKRKLYINELSNQNFICNICNKKHSYNISPYIDENGEVDFSKVICCCTSCRLEKLKSRNIIIPIFKKRINWPKEKEIIKDNLKKFNITKKYRDIYIDLSKKIIIFEKYCDLVLPKKDLDKVESFDKKINLKDCKKKSECKKFLYDISNGYCPVCGKKVRYSDFTIDHLVAKHLGGKDNLNNFIGMCTHCNREKGSKTVLEFLSTKELKKMPPLIVYIAKKQQDNARKEIENLKIKKFEIENKKKHF